MTAVCAFPPKRIALAYFLGDVYVKRRKIAPSACDPYKTASLTSRCSVAQRFVRLTRLLLG
jgi:hypothetical protein